MKKAITMFAAACLAMGTPYSLSNEWNVGFVAQAQSGTVTGVVTDSNGEPLIGAVVRVKGTKVGVNTDVNGKYAIKAAPNATLEFSYVGCEPVSMKASEASNVVLKSKTTLDDVVITAEFGMKRVARAVGSSAQNVKASDIAESGRTDFINALQGRVSGMTVTQSSGAPGASTKVTLRAVTSISGDNQPLYVIDGIPMNNSTFDSGTGFAIADVVSVRDGDFSSRGNDINSEDIESMTVLKGAAAAALYGSDASNGAIIITTKKGRKGKARISYSNQFSWSKAFGWPEVQNRYANGAYGTTNWYYTNHYGGAYPADATYYDNVQAVIQTGFMQRHNVSVEAGNDGMSMRASASLIEQEGVVKTTDLSRKNFSVAGKAKIGTWADFEGSVQYAHQTNQKVLRGTSGPLYRAYIWPNLDNMANYMDEDGRHMRYPEYYTDGDLLNPLFAMYKNKNEDATDRVITTMTLNVRPFKNTFVRGSFGWDFSSSTYVNARHPYYTSYNKTVDDSNNGGSYNISKYNTSDPSLNILAGYNNTFNEKHTFGVQVGYHQQERGVNSLATSGSNFMLIDFYSINNCEASTVTSSKKEYKRRIQAISAQVEYGYNNLAFLTLRARNDWSSTLPVNNRSYFYPAAEFSYIPTEHKAVKDALPWLDYFKLRGSIAQVGKDASALSIDPQLEVAETWGGGYKYGFTGPNKNLKPEMTTSWEVGFEARAWNDRIAADFTYFRTHCADQIVNGFRMSYATGFVLNNLNVGTFNTWGWEGHIDVDVLKTKDLTWNIGLNMSHTGSEVTKLPVAEYYNAYTWIVGNLRNGISVGQPITAMTGRAYQRNDKGQILIDPVSGTPYIDANWTVLGDREPDLRYGITTSLRYKDFRLSANFQGRFGCTIANGTGRDMMTRGLSWESVDQRELGKVVFNGVLKDGNENSDNPTINTIAVDVKSYGSGGWVGNDEDWLQSGIYYLRCQDLRLTYNVNRKWLAKTFRNVISNASVYVSGNDLFTITNYVGYDVVGNATSAAAGGTGGEGIDFWSLPSPRTYTLGFSLTF